MFWQGQADGTSCQAPAGYAAGCESLIEMGGKSDLEKAETENKCQVRWPCVGEYSESLLGIHTPTHLKGAAQKKGATVVTPPMRRREMPVKTHIPDGAFKSGIRD
eukprot:GHVN01087230.1.p2 GENE.GHVN01087230.1~~GHVN01087230.1.p2  ORF type:complete len:105 (+),score=17.12 GHVN01087230.1:1123-1437(+)